MTLILSEPMYHGVAKVIVRPRYDPPAPGIEEALSVVLVDKDGAETTVLGIFGHYKEDGPIEVVVEPAQQTETEAERRAAIHDAAHGTYFPGPCEECAALGWL